MYIIQEVWIPSKSMRLIKVTSLIFWLAVICGIAGLTSCIPIDTSEQSTIRDATPQDFQPKEMARTAEPKQYPMQFDGRTAYQHILKQVGFGFRIPGSRASRLTAVYIKDTLELYDWNVQFQEFKFDGINIRNVIATNSKNNPEILLGTHYDTRSMSDQDENISNISIPVTGANDGASGTATLLEIGRVLAYSEKDIGIIFFDAEDQGGINGWDWSIGSRYFVGRLDYKPDNVVIIDMVGDQDLEVYLEVNSDQTLCAEIWDSAEQLDLQEYFINQVKYSLIDDHLPFIEQGIPACLLIDFDYPFWHTIQDMPDKVSAESLQKVGDILIHWLYKTKPN